MTRYLPILLVLAVLTQATAQEEEPAAANKEQIEAALKITREAAGKYEFAIGDGVNAESPELIAKPILRWSNPAAGEIHGNVFLWTVNSRPVVVGSLFQWFSPHTHTSHEFHSLAEQNLKGKYEDNEVWTTHEPGLEFKDVPESPAPAATAPQRLLQMKKLSKSFSATKKERDGSQSELRLLTQPIYRYAAEKEGLIDGGLFTFVQGTDPDVFLLLEARRADDTTTWNFALTRMNGVGFQVRHGDREIWSKETLPWTDIRSHRETYTTFMFKK